MSHKREREEKRRFTTPKRKEREKNINE